MTSRGKRSGPIATVNHTGTSCGPGCMECAVARVTYSRGYCQCWEPIVEHLAVWDTDQCGRCGKEIRP